MARLYKDPDAGPALARHGDPRGALAAVAEYETLAAFGGYLGLYGADAEAPSAEYVARTRLVMAGVARAQRDQQREMDAKMGADGGGGSMGPQGGTRTRTLSVARSGMAD